MNKDTGIPCSRKQHAWVLHTVSTCGLDLCTWKNQISNSKPDTSHTTRQRLHYLRCHLPPPVPRMAKHEPDKGKRLKTEYRISFQSPQAACNLTPLRFCWSAVRKGVALCMIALAAWGFRSVAIPSCPSLVQTAPEGQMMGFQTSHTVWDGGRHGQRTEATIVLVCNVDRARVNNSDIIFHFSYDY